MAETLSSTSSPGIAELVETRLACPRTHGRLRIDGTAIVCPQSDFTGVIRDGVAVMTPAPQPSFFDDKFEVMRRGHEGEGEWAFCYAQQTALLTGYLRPGQVVLDVGCGPTLPYSKPPGVVVIGLDPSFHSIRANHEVDLRVCGSATAIPMADRSVDTVVCFYSIHHMVGATREDNRRQVEQAFREFGRVLKPEGLLFIFEMTPVTLFSGAQTALWNPVKRLAPRRLDMYFWSAEALARTGQRHLPPGSVLEKIFFGTSAFTMFPPAFALPWLKLPRIVYPLDAKLYKWRIGADAP